MQVINNKEEFDAAISTKRVVVQWGASWCSYCKPAKVLLERLEKETEGTNFAKIELDDNFELAKELEVGSLPTVILFEDGKETRRLVGLKSSEEYKKFVNNN